MKKSKIALVVVLALVLSIACISVPTFSWYVRPNEQSGNKLSWNSNYTISNGEGISMQTLESKDGGKTYTQNVDSFSNELSAGDCKYYRTEIHNTSTSAQNVSLFLSQLDLTGNAGRKFYLGVNGPLRTYKSYPQSNGSGSSGMPNQKVSTNTMRVYFQRNDDLWNDKTYTIHCDGNYYADLTYIKDDSSGGKTYYADIPASTEKFFFTFSYSSLEGWERTKDIYTNDSNEGLSAQNSKVYKIINQLTDNEYKNQVFECYPINAANLINTYDSISLKEDDTFSLDLTHGTDYIGSNIIYSSQNTNIFTVNESGVITANQVGSANLTIKITGETYSDVKEVTIPVTVSKSGTSATGSLIDVPIVTNYKISAAADEENAAVEYVYWYIKNDSDAVLNYTISDIYLSL